MLAGGVNLDRILSGVGVVRREESVEPVSSTSFARGREGSTPTPDWVPAAIAAGVVLLAALAAWYLTRN